MGTRESPGADARDRPETREAQRRFISELSLYSARMRLVFRAVAAALVACLFFLGGAGLAWGALMGALMVEANLSVFHYVVRTSDPAGAESPILVTVLKFYLLFALTAAYVFVCIFFKLGDPRGFLLGALAFLPALMSTFAWALVARLAKRGGGGPRDAGKAV